MKTPIADFVRTYEQKKGSRFHMPGHKGQIFLGCEGFDITEIAGADALYEAEGIIAESEQNASMLFGTGRTVYSTEGSSQCIRAMLYLSIQEWKRRYGTDFHQKPVIVAARNVHKAFVYAAALLDFDILWLWPEQETDSICSCQISSDDLNEILKQQKLPPAAVYVTSPDYLGNQQDLKALADICHKHQTILAVDNAHGAYLHFLDPKYHPMDLGADICCDSAHKTLPVLTGGAYLQISASAPESFSRLAKHAMALFGSTSPSYLTLCSLDLCNAYLSNGYEAHLRKMAEDVKQLKEVLHLNGWQTEGTEVSKLTLRMPDTLRGTDLAQTLRSHEIECEFADPEYVVFMFTPENQNRELSRLEKVLGKNLFPYQKKKPLPIQKLEQKLSVREALFLPQEEICAKNALGRICGTVSVSCPPAVPIVVSGEQITEDSIELFRYYGIDQIYVVAGSV